MPAAASASAIRANDPSSESATSVSPSAPLRNVVIGFSSVTGRSASMRCMASRTPPAMADGDEAARTTICMSALGPCACG